METTHIDDAITSLEKANADLQPQLLSENEARDMFAAFAQAEKLAAFGKTMMASRIEDAQDVAKMTGVSIGKAKSVVETGMALSETPEVRGAFRAGSISLDQAAEIARADVAQPGAATELLGIANKESFQVLRERSRRVVLEAEQHKDLPQRQREARAARHHVDELGMIDVHLRWQPHVGTPIMNRAETEAARLHRSAKRAGDPEPFERYLADAYAKLFFGSGSGSARKPEVVVVVSHEVAQRGWTDVQEGEVCKIPGVGPVAPQDAKAIAEDAFLTGVVCDGKDLRQMKRWTRNIPVEVELALNLGDPPDFDGKKCADCGSRFKNEIDHIEPHVAGGPASTQNNEPRCWTCHRAKTLRDLRAGKFTSRVPDADPPKRPSTNHLIRTLKSKQ